MSGTDVNGTELTEMTWVDFCAAGEDLRGEYVAGRLVQADGFTLEHQIAVANLWAALHDRGVRSVAQWAWRPPHHEAEYHPDVLVPAGTIDGSDHWTELPPTLVVEVTSPDDASKDWVRNVRDYARFGAPHYWILDHRDHRLTAFALQEGQYEETAQGDTSVLVPGWEQLGEIDAAALWT